MRKTSHILSGLSDIVPPNARDPTTYYALDLQESELVRTLNELNQSVVGDKIRGKIVTKGLCGTFDDGLTFIENGGLDGADQYRYLSNSDLIPSSPPPPIAPEGAITVADVSRSTHRRKQPLHILFLGSSLGNFARGDDAAFLRSLPLRAGSGDTLLLGLDHDNNPKDILNAYNDSKGLSKAFALNGLRSTGRALGDETLFQECNWDYVGSYNDTECECIILL